LNTIIFVFSTFTSSFFFLTYFPRLFIISFISLSLLATITKSTFYVPTTLTSPPPLVLSLIFHPYLSHQAGSPVSLPLSFQTIHLLLFHLYFAFCFCVYLLNLPHQLFAYFSLSLIHADIFFLPIRKRRKEWRFSLKKNSDDVNAQKPMMLQVIGWYFSK
jgi:hypothetical protein